MAKKYGSKLKTDDDVEKFLSYLTGHGVQVDRADYEGNVIDLEIGTVGVTVSYDLVPSPCVLMMKHLHYLIWLIISAQKHLLVN